MSLHLIYGAAGSGKSTVIQNRMINEAIANPGKQYLMIVPDQFTMQTQMDMVKRHPNGGIMNIDVLSFSRLAYRVFSETGKPGYAVLDDTGKSLVLRHVASQVSDKMPYIGANLNKIGYIHEVKSMISEFMQYGLSVKDVAKLTDSLDDGLLKAKLNDLNVIYSAFSEYNKERFITSEETLDILCSKLSEAEFIKNSEVVFDGFTGFTPIQENVILKLLELAAHVTVTLTLSQPENPEDIGGEEKLFYLTRTTGNRLTALAKEAGIRVDDYEIIKSESGRFINNPELSHLENNLFRYSFQKYSKKPKDISVFKCKDIEAEVSEITLKIHELIRSGKYAYKDIAVVVGDLNAYGDIFENRFNEISVPCFVDRTTGIVLNPFIEYLKSAMQIIIKDYSYDSVFHYLKSGFVDYEEDDIDRFGKYAASLNLRGKNTYSREFTKRQKGMKKEFALSEVAIHDELRKQLVSELEVLSCPFETAGEFVKNFYEFIVNNHSYDKIQAYADMFAQNNDLAKAKEYGQIYKLIMELLDTIYNLIGDEKMDLPEFYKIFEAGINEIQVGTIPRNVDRVLVGDIERTRLNEVKVLFFAGVNDGNIPKAGDSSGILSNSEREIIAAKNYDLSPTDALKMYTQRLYLYANLCKPTDKLFISFAAADREGKGLKASYLINTLTRLYPELSVEEPDEDVSVGRIINIKDSLRFYSDLVNRYSLKSLTDAEKKITECLMKLYRESGENVADEILEAAFCEYAGTNLSREIVKLIYGETISASISRMEMYARCAYAHFLKYGMELSDKAESEFGVVDLGSVYHGILDVFSAKLEALNMSLFDFDEETGRRLLNEAIISYCEDYEQGILNDNERTSYVITKITRIMERTIDTIKYQLNQGKYVPNMHEHPFVREIPLDNGTMNLRGRIDRVDLYSEGNRIYVRIVDYKSSGRSIDITNVYHGIEQQLPLYMAEAIYHEKKLHPGAEVIPAALFYYKVDNPMIDAKEGDSESKLTDEIRRKLGFEGMINSDMDVINSMDKDAVKATVLPVTFTSTGKMRATNSAVSAEGLKNMSEYTEKLVTSIGNRINEGDITINPMRASNKDACEYCGYKSICRFDNKIPGFRENERSGKEVNADEARERVLGGKEDGLYLFD